MFMFVFSLSAISADKIKPYVLASNQAGDFAETTAQVKASLIDAGFTIVGSYQPYDGADIQIATNDALKTVAAKSENGGFGAVIRIATTQVEESIQVSYTNPEYMSAMYRMDGDLSDISSALSKHLGAESTFGSKKGLKPKKARKYHYMAFMPYFDDVEELAEYDSHQAAIEAVEKGLSAGIAGVTKAYRVDIPGSEMTLFGVILSDGKGADSTIMEKIDKGDLKHTAHLPYEMLVNGKEVISLHGKFRIAQSFPDLTMGSFMKIQSAPGAIADSLEEVAQNK